MTMHARARVTGDASLCGLSNARHATLDNARVTCTKCKRIVTKQTADANAAIAARRAAKQPKHDFATVADCAACHKPYSEHRDGDEACPGHFDDRNPPLYIDPQYGVVSTTPALTTHLIVDVTDAHHTSTTSLACGGIVGSGNGTRNRTRVSCIRCLAELRERFAPNPLNAPAPTDDRDALIAALESVILVAEDCQQRWSRSHPATVAAARAVLVAAKART